MKSIRTQAIFAALFVAAQSFGSTALGQTLADISVLQVESPAQCAALTSELDGMESGSQWMIGEDIPLFNLPASRTTMTTIQSSFEKVRCFGSQDLNNSRRVFVATADGATCGWVDQDNLLDENRRSLTAFGQNRAAVCPVPRAMDFDTFCSELESLSSDSDNACLGVPAGLRAKGILVGSTSETSVNQFNFMTAPQGGEARESKTFFSVLEIHDIARGQGSDVMLLVGDGEGDIFGWINRDAIELWPTRLGLFYDVDGAGQMFQRQRDLISNWRRNTPAPDVTSGLSVSELSDYVHGSLQLLSYPIIRTINPGLDLVTEGTDTPFHEVIFLGQTGDGSASELMSEAQFANDIEALQQLNLMIVLDTTESMREYLPLIQQGVTDFILDYERRSLDASNRLPDVRIAVYAYSDFISAGATSIGSPITTAVLMPPTRVGIGRDVSSIVQRISAHTGLDDAVGLREESALEAVAQFSDEFDVGGAWFDDGPRVILHIADHGSRSDSIVAQALRKLETNNTSYFPIAVITADKTATSTTARQAFLRQATAMLTPIVKGTPTSEDVQRVNLTDFKSTTAQIVTDQINLVMNEIIAAVTKIRGEIIGDTLTFSSQLAQDRLASRIILDEILANEVREGQIGTQTIVQASTAFAPFYTQTNGINQPIDWTYTVALEPQQATFLRQNFEQMCGMVGSPDQSAAFRTLIVRVAEAFSGDTIDEDKQVRAILSDMRNLPGADLSFLSQQPQTLLQRADSTDPAIIDEFRRDVCWISYHLGNMDAGVYARPDQLVWSGQEFRLTAGEQVTAREYRYKPVIGAETLYLPSFFLVLPSVVEDREVEGTCEFFCN